MGRNQKYGNDTVDVLNKGCIDNFNIIACGRISLLVIICSITCLLLLIKIIKYHINKHSQVHHYVIFYVSIILCLSCGASSIFGVRYPQLDFSTNFLKLLQFILICHYYWSKITHSRHRDDILQHVVNPILCLFMLYCTIVVLMGMVDTSGTWIECLRPYWLMLSIADLIAVQLFSIFSIYITHYNYHKHHNHKNTNNRKNIINYKNHDILIVILIYQLSAIISVLFDSIMIIFSNNENGCSFIYKHTQIYYSFINFIFIIIKFLLPIWILLWLFKPIRVKSRPSEVALTSHYNNIDGNYYRQIYFNCGDDNNTQIRNNDNTIINYPIEQSSIYGSFVDFSCTDSSSSDLSPTTNYWSSDKYEKDNNNDNNNCEINNINYCIDDNSHKYDNNIQIGIQENKKIQLTTINEESGGIMMENLYD